MMYNIFVGKIGTREIKFIQRVINSKKSGVYELKEIFQEILWRKVIRPRFLGRVISKLVDEGVFENIEKIRKKSNKHIEYKISK